MGLGPPKRKYSPPKQNEAHWPFLVWTYVFRFSNVLSDQLKELAAGENIVFTSKKVGSNFNRNLPSKPKILATFLRVPCVIRHQWCEHVYATALRIQSNINSVNLSPYPHGVNYRFATKRTIEALAGRVDIGTLDCTASWGVIR